MPRTSVLLLTTSYMLTFVSISAAGPFSHTSISANDPLIMAWASEAILTPGPHGASANGNDATGPADGLTASLGELAVSEFGSLAAGQITVSFGSGSLIDLPGDDFVIFENAFEFSSDPGFWFAELAFVEVSTNGVDFARFPVTSLNTEGAGNPATDIILPFGRTFAGVDPTNINGLAGFDGPLSFGGTPRGTPFDLENLILTPEVISGAVDLSHINFVRLVDILGNGDVMDDFANPIFDGFDDINAPPTGINGFDLDAIGLIHAIPEPSSIVLVGLLGIAASLTARRRQ